MPFLNYIPISFLCEVPFVCLLSKIRVYLHRRFPSVPCSKKEAEEKKKCT